MTFFLELFSKQFSVLQPPECPFKFNSRSAQPSLGPRPNAVDMRTKTGTVFPELQSFRPRGVLSRRRLCASLRSRNQHRISKRHSCADETTSTERAPRWAPDLYSYRKNPFSVATVWGIKAMLRCKVSCWKWEIFERVNKCQPTSNNEIPFFIF